MSATPNRTLFRVTRRVSVEPAKTRRAVTLGVVIDSHCEEAIPGGSDRTRGRSGSGPGAPWPGRVANRPALAPHPPFMKVGVLITGDRAVRAAHSLAADPSVDEVVVVGPAKSRSFEVVDTPTGCDVLIGSGPGAPGRARGYGLPLIWDGNKPAKGTLVWGANLAGLTLAVAGRETRPSIVAYAHPDESPAGDRSVRFPKPVGAIGVEETTIGDRTLFKGKSYNEYAGCLVVSKTRSVTIVDRADFLSGVALAAGISAVGQAAPGPVWENSLAYLETATAMGLVMAIDN